MIFRAVLLLSIGLLVAEGEVIGAPPASRDSSGDLDQTAGDSPVQQGYKIKMAEEKTQWAECMNLTGEEAKAIIEKERPDLKIQIMKDNQPATMDFRPDRVRIVVSHETGKVVMAPHTG